MSSSQGSIGLDISVNPQDENNSTASNDRTREDKLPGRSKRWIFRRQSKTSGQDPDADKLKSFNISCRCKGAINLNCLIISSAFVEMLANVISLLYGVTYILSAGDFYAVDSGSLTLNQDYDKQLQRVLFLDKYRVGFVGLQAISLMGLAVSFMIPIAVIYRSWRCIRTGMSLLFAMCVFHLVLVIFYLRDSQFAYTLSALPVRACELFLLYRYICFYKKKKLADIKSGQKKISSSTDGANDRKLNTGARDLALLDPASILSLDQNQNKVLGLGLGASNSGSASQANEVVEVTAGLNSAENMNMAGGAILVPVPENTLDAQSIGLTPGVKIRKKKRAKLFGIWLNQEKQEEKVHYSIPDRYIDYK